MSINMNFFVFPGVAPLESAEPVAACPACTYHNLPERVRCDMCETPLPHQHHGMRANPFAFFEQHQQQQHRYQHLQHFGSPFGSFPFGAGFAPFSMNSPNMAQFMQGGGNKPKPAASQKVVRDLPQEVPPPRSSCTVCMEDFEAEERATRLPCNHVFHKDCLGPWLKDNNCCPNCRFELLTDDAEYNKDVEAKMLARGISPMSCADHKSVPASATCGALLVGARVRVSGLRQRGDLNGRFGQVVGAPVQDSKNAQHWRFPVKVAGQTVLLRPSNLECLEPLTLVRPSPHSSMASPSTTTI